MNEYTVSPDGRELIKTFEGLRLTAYQDQVGVWTIGYGHTANVHPGQTITEAQADELLKQDLHVCEACIRRLVTVELTQNQFDALASFVFNLGCANLERSTLLRLLNEGDYAGAANEFGRWNHAGNQVLEGLTRRREQEAMLFEEPPTPIA